MPRPNQNKLYQTFVKGLITEAGPLNYPENASTDELNTVIKVKGSRSRRLGLDFEPSSVASTIAGTVDTDIIAEYAWKGVGNDSSVNFLVVQHGSLLHFYNMDAVPITSDKKTFTVDLSTYLAPFASAGDLTTTPVHMASGKGWLFVACGFIEPVIIEYNKAADTISVLKIVIKVRDFDGIDDGLGNEAQPATLSNEHYYNLRNQGWVQPGPLGASEGTPSTTYTGSAPSGSSTGTGGGGHYYGEDGLTHDL